MGINLRVRPSEKLLASMELSRPHASTKELPMTLTVAQLAQAMQTLLTADAEQAAREAAFVKRKRQLTGPAFAQALVFGWMAKPDATLENLAVTAAAAAADVTAQAVDR